jgi:hypothetical protein
MICWRNLVRSYIIKNVHFVCGPMIENSTSVLPECVGASLLSHLRKGTDVIPEILFSFSNTMKITKCRNLGMRSAISCS